jgi:hypothetical protein
MIGTSLRALDGRKARLSLRHSRIGRTQAPNGRCRMCVEHSKAGHETWGAGLPRARGKQTSRCPSGFGAIHSVEGPPIDDGNWSS